MRFLLQKWRVSGSSCFLLFGVMDDDDGMQAVNRRRRRE